MRYKSKIISCFLMFCLITIVLYTDEMSVVSEAGSSNTRIRLRIDNHVVSRKTISIKKGKKKKIKLNISQKKKYKITFRSSKGSVATVSKKGKITAKRVGTAKITVIAKPKKKKYKSWIKVKVVSSNKKSDVPLPTKGPVPSQTDTPALPTNEPTLTPSDSSTTEQGESNAPDTGAVSDMYEVTIKVNGKVFPAKLYQTETTKSIMQKLPLSITMDELNGNEKYYYFSESFPIEPERVSEIHAGDLKLYGSSCLVLFYESFATSYSYTSLGYVENPEGLAKALGTGSVHVDIFCSE
ncbi:MAG: Ig-like domain-containing protein [Lachnospiraceae bacterium]|nr:Ig-like domain-containing protein [Lachnospiraceae bacterium]